MEELYAFCGRHGIPLVGLKDEVWEAKTQEYFYSDGLHFTKSGNFLLASIVSDFLSKTPCAQTKEPIVKNTYAPQTCLVG